MTLSEHNAPNLTRVVEAIGSKSPFQKKSSNQYLSTADARFFEFAEGWVSRLMAALGDQGTPDKLAEAYVWYTKLIRIEELYFAKEKKYRFENFDEVNERVYSRDDYMVDYVVGLGMTQLFWPNHYGIVRFFLDTFIPTVRAAKRGAEVGVGHGLFHSQLLAGAPEIETHMLDISPTSLAFTHKVIEAMGMDKDRATPVLGDIQKQMPVEDESLDALLFGEAIEHLQEGEKVFSQLATKMKPDGRCFFTTAANAPAEDHILLFRGVGEIRDVIDACGWSILEEFTATLGDMSVEQAERENQNINYAAVLAKK